MAAMLKNRYYVITLPAIVLIKMKFGMLMQNHMPMTTHGSKFKLEIEFQYGDRPFSQTGSSFISTVD